MFTGIIEHSGTIESLSVHNDGGRVTIESSPDKGTTVRCHLPTGHRPAATVASLETAAGTIH